MLSRQNKKVEKVACKSMLCVYSSHQRVRVACTLILYIVSIITLTTRVNMIMPAESGPCAQSINVE